MGVFSGDANAIRGGTATDRDNFLLINPDGSITVSSAAGVTPLTITTDTVVSVTPSGVTILAANPNRKNAIVQNLNAAVLQVYFTNAQAFGAGGIQLQQYQTWEAAQATGVYQGIVYGRYSAATANVGRIEEE